MSDKSADIIGKIKATRRSGRRSPLFLWMYANYNQLVSALDRPDWQAACRLFAAEELWGSDGKPVGPKAAQMTWQRVRKAVAKDRQSRPRTTTVQEFMAKQPAAPAVAPPPASVEASPGTSAEPACIASLRRQIDERVLGAPRPMPVLAPPASIQSAAPGAFERYVAQREAALLGDKPAPEAPPSPKGAQAAPPADPTTPDATPRRRRRAY